MGILKGFVYFYGSLHCSHSCLKDFAMRLNLGIFMNSSLPSAKTWAKLSEPKMTLFQCRHASLALGQDLSHYCGLSQQHRILSSHCRFRTGGFFGVCQERSCLQDLNVKVIGADSFQLHFNNLNRHHRQYNAAYNIILPDATEINAHKSCFDRSCPMTCS